MANISAKSGNLCTQTELEALNTRIVSLDTTSFFGQDPLPLPTHHLDLCTYQTMDEMDNEESFGVMHALNHTIKLGVEEEDEPAVHDFAMDILKTMGYSISFRPHLQVVQAFTKIPFIACHQKTQIETSVCLTQGNRNQEEFLLPVVEDTRHKSYGDPLADPHAKIIAAAIAAFQSNNSLRRKQDREELDFKLVPGIVLLGTSPTFFKIPVTPELAEAVQEGRYPDKPTVVEMHQPTLPQPTCPLSKAMEPLENRRVILSCYESFKQFVP